MIPHKENSKSKSEDNTKKNTDLNSFDSFPVEEKNPIFKEISNRKLYGNEKVCLPFDVYCVRHFNKNFFWFFICVFVSIITDGTTGCMIFNFIILFWKCLELMSLYQFKYLGIYMAQLGHFIFVLFSLIWGTINLIKPDLTP